MTMDIQYVSDLHLEFRENKHYLTGKPIKPVGEVLILAGDIVPFAVMNQHVDFFDWISDHFETTYWLPGNHEYYHFELTDRCGTIMEKIRSNVWLVNNVSIRRGDVRFVFSTLWTHIGLANQWSVRQGMADFHVIKYQGKSFTPSDYNEQHQVCLNFLKTELAQQVEKTMVVSHHVPTFLNYPEKYKSNILNEAFAVELFDLIESSRADYWIYGHHHQPVPTFTIGSTSLVTNQLGYVRYNEQAWFNQEAIVKL